MKKFVYAFGDYAKQNKGLNKIRGFFSKAGIIPFLHTYVLNPKPLKDDLHAMNEYMVANSSSVNEICEMLCDEKSRNIYRNIIKFRCTGKIMALSSILPGDGNLFPNEILALSSDEVFIDGGGYDGDTMIQFMQSVNYLYSQIILFEPNAENCQIIEKTIKEMDAENIVVYEEGLWSDQTRLAFMTDNSGGSHIADFSSETINQSSNSMDIIEIDVNSIDNVMTNAVPTLIKLDIEGAEMEALKGAANTIRKHKPKLAISIYHKKSDFVEIPLYLKTLVPEYKLFVRHFSNYIYETVLYAVV